MRNPSLLPPLDQRQHAIRWLPVWLAVAAGLHLAALTVAEPLQSANDRSRWATVWALAENGDFHIDEIDRREGWSTIDKVQVDGHLYSSKPALLPVMIAGLYRGLYQLTGWSILEETALVTQTLLGIVNLVPWILAWVAVAAMARKYAESRFTRAFVVATIAGGTYLSTFQATLNNHTIAATSLIFALFFATRIVADESRRASDFLLCGLAAAFVTTNELPAALFGLALFGLLFWHDWKRTSFLFVPAALVPIGAFFYTTWLQTGGWKPFYLSYGTETYIFIRDGLPSYWAFPHGLDRAIDPMGTYLFHCLLGHHGILSLSPVFFLTLAGWCVMYALPNARLRPFQIMGLVLTLAILGFYLSRTENYNYGGNTVALRWAMWLIPFWVLGLIPILDRYAHRRGFRAVAVVLLAISTFSAWESFAKPWGPSWLYDAMETAGVIDYTDPPARLDRTLSTIIDTLPEPTADPETAWIELTALTKQGRQTLRISLVSSNADQVATKLAKRESGPGIPSRLVAETTATWDRAAFEEGLPPADCVIAGEPSRDAALRRFQGLPSPETFRPRQTRFVKIPGWKYAFRAIQSTGSVDVRRESGAVIRHRIDIWTCEDVPFGVIRLRYTWQNARSGQLLGQKEFTLSAAGRREIPAWVRRIEGMGAGEGRVE